jgi:hypothetical protein
MASGAMIYIPSLIKIGSAIQKLTRRIHRHTNSKVISNPTIILKIITDHDPSVAHEGVLKAPIAVVMSPAGLGTKMTVLAKAATFNPQTSSRLA